MARIDLIVTGDTAKIKVTGTIAARATDVRIVLHYDIDAFEGLAPYLEVRAGDKWLPVLVTHDPMHPGIAEAICPWEVLVAGYRLKIGVVFLEEGAAMRHPTTWAVAGVVNMAPGEEELPEVSPQLAEQVIAKADLAEQMAGEAKRDAAQAAGDAAEAAESAGQAEIHAQNAANSAAQAARDAADAELAADNAESAARNAERDAAAAAVEARNAAQAAFHAANDAETAVSAAESAERTARAAESRADEAWDQADNAINEARFAKNVAGGKYSKPSDGIPEADLTAELQQKLNTGGGGLSAAAAAVLLEILSAAVYTQNVSGKISKLKELLTSGAPDDPDEPVIPEDEIAVEDGVMTITAVYSEITVEDGAMTIQ